MIPGESRLDYAVSVPKGGRTVSVWTARWHDAAVARTKRALGPAPDVTLEDFDERPGVCRTRVTLTAADEATAQFRSVSFVVDRDFANMLRPRDVVHIAQNWHGGLGISVLRGGVLIAAAGSVSAVPLGETLEVRRPGELASDAHAVYRRRDPQYEPWEDPVQIESDTALRLVHRGRIELGHHEFFVVHGFVLGTECVAISFVGVCPDCAATLTAPLLTAPDALCVRGFRDRRALADERETKVLFALEAAKVALESDDLDAAHEAALEALIWDPHTGRAQELLEEIERRRSR